MVGYTKLLSVACIAGKGVCFMHTGAEESVLTGIQESIRLKTQQSFLRI